MFKFNFHSILSNQWGVPQGSYYEPYNLGKYDGFLTELKLNRIVNCETVQVKNYTSSFFDLKVYPVPGRDFVYVKTDQLLTNPIEVAIFNLLGQVVNKYQVEQFSPDNLLLLDIHNLSSGNYFISLISARKIGTAKILKH